MNRSILLSAFMCTVALTPGFAQDKNERVYNYEVLNAQGNTRNITPKPKVQGWASERVKENLGRGVCLVDAKTVKQLWEIGHEADVPGCTDWIWWDADNLREMPVIYTTTIPETDRKVNLMQDPLYRSYVSSRSMGYTQAPTPSYNF